MKDNNKKIIIAIIAVATIIVAIIGATFAFFSASGGSANNAVTANATTLSNLGFVSSHSKIAYNLVPVASESPYFSRYPGIAASGEHSCLDDVGNQICSIYEFTITNTASVAQTIYVSFVPSENTFDNMYFAAFNTSIASASYVVATGSNGSGNNFSLTAQTTSGNSTLGHQATKLTKNSTSPISMPSLSKSLGAGESVTYTILVWLQETGTTQNTEQGGSFKAGVNVTTGGNSTGVTGIIGDSATYVYTINNSSEGIVYVGQAIPNTITTYSTPSSALSANNYGPFYLKHKINNGIVEASYVEFVVTPDMVTSASQTYIYNCYGNESCINSYQGMTAGTYTLPIGTNGEYYDSNKNILLTAFGSSRCWNESTFRCYNGGIEAAVYTNGARVSSNPWQCNLDYYRDNSLQSSCGYVD